MDLGTQGLDWGLLPTLPTMPTLSIPPSPPIPSSPPIPPTLPSPPTLTISSQVKRSLERWWAVIQSHCRRLGKPDTGLGKEEYIIIFKKVYR